MLMLVSYKGAAGAPGDDQGGVFPVGCTPQELVDAEVIPLNPQLFGLCTVSETICRKSAGYTAMDGSLDTSISRVGQ